MNYIEENSRVWDEHAKNSNQWTVPVSSEEVEAARQGKIQIVVTPSKIIPRDWFPQDLKGKKILCLASGGGQQGPILAAAGARVTVLDNSKGQLDKDAFVANRDGLEIELVQGNMQDLSIFQDESFDCVINPWSNGYIDDVKVVWRECARVLKRGGILIAGFGNPTEYIFNVGKLEQGILEVSNTLPYADIEHMDDLATKALVESDGFVWSHTLTDQIGGQIDAGFAIVGFYEDRGGTVLDQYMQGSIATKAIKL